MVDLGRNRRKGLVMIKQFSVRGSTKESGSKGLSRIRLSRIRKSLRGDSGLTTAEYAIGTVAVAGLGGVLIKLLSSDAVRDLIWSILQGAFSAMLGS